MSDGKPGPDPEMDGLVGSWLTDTDLTPAEAHAGLARLLDEFPVTPQNRRRSLGRWLARDEGAGRRASGQDNPSTMDRRTRLMFSATGAIAAIAILALTVSVFDIAPEPPGSDAGTIHVVASDGSGDHLTISEAVAAAVDGDTVTVKPGRYVEAIVVKKDITLAGDGPREQVIIVAPDGGAPGMDELDKPFAIMLQGGAPTVSDLTIEVPVGGAGIGATPRDGAERATPLIERVTIVRVEPETVPYVNADYYALGFHGAVSPTVRDSQLAAYVAVRGATALLEGNTFAVSIISIDGPGDSVVRGNMFTDGSGVNGTGATATIEGNHFSSGSHVSFDSASVADVRANTFEDGPDPWGAMISARDDGTRLTIADNTLSGSRGIDITSGASADIRGNQLIADRLGITVSSADASISDTTIGGAGLGIVVSSRADVVISHNIVHVEGVGIVVDSSSSAAVSGNDVCGDRRSLSTAESASVELTENELC